MVPEPMPILPGDYDELLERRARCDDHGKMYRDFGRLLGEVIFELEHGPSAQRTRLIRELRGLPAAMSAKQEGR